MFQVGDKVLYRKVENKSRVLRGVYERRHEEWLVPATVMDFSERSILIQFDGSTVGKWIKKEVAAEKLKKSAVSA